MSTSSPSVLVLNKPSTSFARRSWCAAHRASSTNFVASRHVAAASRLQVSLRSQAKPGRGGVNLRVLDFKKTAKLYLVTSREAPTIFWLEVLNPSHRAVLEYVERDKSAYDGQMNLDHGDVFDTFISEFSTKESRALLEGRQQVPLVMGQVGKVYPGILDLKDTIKSALGVHATCQCNLLLLHSLLVCNPPLPKSHVLRGFGFARAEDAHFAYFLAEVRDQDMGFENDGLGDDEVEDEADAEESALNSSQVAAQADAAVEDAADMHPDDPALAAAAAAAARARQEGEEGREEWLEQGPQRPGDEQEGQAVGGGQQAVLDLDKPRDQTRPADPMHLAEQMHMEGGHGVEVEVEAAVPGVAVSAAPGIAAATGAATGPASMELDPGSAEAVRPPSCPLSPQAQW